MMHSEYNKLSEEFHALLPRFKVLLKERIKSDEFFVLKERIKVLDQKLRAFESNM